jgi:hypothetical protein
LPSNQNLLYWILKKIEKDKKMKKQVLRFLANADFGHINDIIIKDEEIPASVIERLPDEAKSQLKTPDGKYMVKEVFLSHD